MKLNFKRKIFLLAAAVATLPVALVLMMMLALKQRMFSGIEELSTTSAQEQLSDTCKVIYNRFQATNSLLEAHVKRNLKVGEYLLSEAGGLGFSSTVHIWTAVNSFTNETHTVSLPASHLKGQSLNSQNESGEPSLVLDKIADLTGASVSLFQRMNEEGDMIRIASTLTDAKKHRLVGAFIPAHQANGVSTPLVSAVLNGGTYVGRSPMNDVDHIGAYQGIRDRSGRLIGMINTGQEIKSQSFKQDGLEQLYLGKDRELLVIGCHGTQRGRVLLSTGGERDGKLVVSDLDESGRSYIEAEIKQALQNPPGKLLSDSYVPAGGSKRSAVFTYYEPWGWLIHVSLSQKEFLATGEHALAVLRQLLWGLITAGLVSLTIALIVAYWIGGRLTTGVELLDRVAQMMAQGNLAAAENEISSRGNLVANERRTFRDENQRLLEAFSKMIATLGALIGEVQQSGIQVTTSTTEIAASARQLEATAGEQATSARDVSATAARISSTSGELLKSVNSVADALAAATLQAESGRTELHRMEAAMGQLSAATASLCSRLNTISDRAGTISGVVTTINKISDRTALLSVNAAIEAEKAGEFGKGFSVVAREISRLADQTATATQDIESVVKEMQSSVASGVGEVSIFSEEVRQHIIAMNRVAQGMNEIINRVQKLGPDFESSRGGMRVQADSANQIAGSIEQLSVAAEQSKESLSQFKFATEQLNAAVLHLRAQVSQFTLNT